MAKILGVKEEVTSPTFVIMKVYNREVSPLGKEGLTTSVPWKRLVHIDAYRLEQPSELEALNFEQVVADRRNLVLIEWPENVGLKDFQEKAKLHFEIVEGVYRIVVA